jgi:dienelactone hydrolase
MTRIIIEESNVEEIPVRRIFPEEAEQLPIVVYIHGHGGDKEQALDYGYTIAKQGFYFVSFDCDEHGSRKANHANTSGHRNRRFHNVYPPDTGIDTYIHMHEVIEQTGRDVEMPIEHFKGLKQVDTDRIGLTGFSMGAFASFYIAANNSAIKVAVPIGGIRS